MEDTMEREDSKQHDTETTSTPTPRKKVGFAAMDPKKVAEIASRGGKAAHRAGTAHEFARGSDEAREAGRKGGHAVHAKREAEEKARSK
jgi:general stress protein YciG